jgi:hypothetical protein
MPAVEPPARRRRAPRDDWQRSPGGRIWLPPYADETVPAEAGVSPVVVQPRRRNPFSTAGLSGKVWHAEVKSSGVLWTDTGGTTPATADGNNVGRLTVQTGTNLTQATNQPTRQTHSSRTVVRFDGTNDCLTSNQTFTAGNAKFLVVVFRHSTDLSGTTTRCDLLNLGGTTSQFWFSSGGNTASLARLSWGANKTSTTTTFVGSNTYTITTNTRIVVIYFDGVDTTATSSYRCWVDGVEHTVSSRVVSAGASGTTSIGARSAGTQAFPGDFFEGFLFEGVNHSASANDIYTEMHAKWVA